MLTKEQVREIVSTWDISGDTPLRFTLRNGKLIASSHECCFPVPEGWRGPSCNGKVPYCCVYKFKSIDEIVKHHTRLEEMLAESLVEELIERGDWPKENTADG